MIYEYAISPALFAHEDRIALMVASLGHGQGRLVSDLPKDKWEQLALHFIKQNAAGDAQLAAWKEALFSLRKRSALFRRQSARWDDSAAWIDNTISEHGRVPFRAIVNDAAHSTCADVVAYGIGLVGHAKWTSPANAHIGRNAPAIVAQMSGLLDLSGTVVLVDRNFCIDDRFMKVVVELARYLDTKKQGPRVDQIKYVISDVAGQPKQVESDCVKQLAPRLPARVSVKFHFKSKGKLHPRFLLTDRGGLNFESGLDEGNGLTLVSRLSEDAWTQEWSSWSNDVYQSFEIRRPA
jgi:hypothetical protein